jgi:lysyl-tRNA synthetase class 2
MSDGADWRPSADRGRLAQRAALMARVREFFAARGVLEVDTPLLVNAPVSDVHIHSATVRVAPDAPSFFLHTSPEYAMKRLLAAGCGDIFQVCHVVRGFESGRLHNPEFTLVEWYRLGFSLEQLMGEVDELVRVMLGLAATRRRTEHLTYREAFVRELSLDPLTASAAQLAQAAAPLGLSAPGSTAAATDTDPAGARDELLELLMGARVGPRLGQSALTFVRGYPATQAALARLDPADPRTARRFELYCDGIELANGFHELASAPEQRARFAADNAERARRGLPVHAPDERLLAALAAGLPDCAGVALGFDRTLMLAAQAACLDEVLPFPTDRA